ncbi:hypothetical protein GCM10007377_15890 [Galliscardovia ingluviei]|uniref:Uncharacterized protein n=1 Tax=Galliscardovia ingluviei TaxID=1769422 RepID=A0A8J3F0E7_9BIFI|nr:hypothetical protein [Galliscardovia ingluviei]GGI15436.1 hypothetical protein GCM10007377_15890 [Galliscardovia ingluviei]
MKLEITQALATIATKSRYTRIGFVQQLVSAYEDYQHSPRAQRYQRYSVRIARACPKMMEGAHYARQVLDNDIAFAGRYRVTRGAYLRMVYDIYTDSDMNKEISWEGIANTLPQLYS